MNSSSPLGDASFLPVTIFAPSGCAIFGRVQRAIQPVALGLMMVSWGSFCNSSPSSLHMLQVCPPVPFQTCRNHSMNC